MVFVQKRCHSQQQAYGDKRFHNNCPSRSSFCSTLQCLCFILLSTVCLTLSMFSFASVSQCLQCFSYPCLPLSCKYYSLLSQCLLALQYLVFLFPAVLVSTFVSLFPNVLCTFSCSVLMQKEKSVFFYLISFHLFSTYSLVNLYIRKCTSMAASEEFRLLIALHRRHANEFSFCDWFVTATSYKEVELFF